MDLKQKFLILKKMKYSESDLILHALSPSGAKVSFIAKGALKSKKRFGGGILEPTHFLAITYKPAREEGRLNVILEASLIQDFSKIRNTYEQLEFALHVIECIYKVSVEGDQSSDSLFNLLGQSLKAIELTTKIENLKIHFYLKFLLQHGVLTPEPWMAPYLKTPLSQSHEVDFLIEDVSIHLSTLEKSVRHYLESAVMQDF